jgi:LPPG:FO 2-phospho-L-lactate transferase
MSVRVTLLCGGVGGAKLARGFHLLSDDVDLTVIVNTGDDFEHLGFTICPDLDTVLYTLSGQANVAQGWGRQDESWTFMQVLRTLGGEDWFSLGDGDLALHTFRSERLRKGVRLSQVTAQVCNAWHVGATILPMSDDPVRTLVHTELGVLAFQRYFVEQRCAPRTSKISFDGADTARPAPGVVAAIQMADVVVIAPSNPYLSIDPILAVPGLSEVIKATKSAVIAVSPLVAGKAVKGPTAKLMTELGFDVGNAAIAGHYAELIDGLLVHVGDWAADGGPIFGRARTDRALRPTREADIMMRDDADRMRVARDVLRFAGELGSR